MSMGSRPNRSALRERDQQVVERLSRPKSVTPPVSSAKKGGHGRHNSENLNPDEFSIVRVNNNHNAGSSELGVPKTGSKRPPRHLPPRPPSAKRKLEPDSFVDAQQTQSERHASLCALNDSGVQVIVRIRPMRAEENEVTPIVHLLSQNTIAVVDQQFTYDAVAGDESTQKDIFEMVGVPLVENCMAGFNSSIFAYGQTGSGKTYTMWGPMYDLSGELFPNKDRGLTPRVFEQLFARIQEEEAKNVDKQLRYQCRCSFLEIYNEQITDLLEPNQKNLQVREDTKCGVYVDNLTEEYVSSVDDVSRLALRGLANRKVGATNMNAESSRSHSVFTCVLESRYKCATSGLSSLKTSRINLVDLAGSERQKSTGAVGERLKEAGNINRSLSQLGNLIKILAEVSQTGKQRHIPYRDSRLTFLLQESLGGNAKLAMICSISPAASCRSETLSTLRFAQRAKAIKNKAVVNEETTESDVNFLRDQIRQLKNELMRMKSKDNQPSSNSGYSTGWDARRSYNLLKLSLNRPLTVIPEDSDSDEEMEIDETEVEGPNIIGGNNSIQTEQRKNQTETETVDSTSTVFEPENMEISAVKSIKFNIEVAQNCELSTQNQMIPDVVLTDVGAMTLPELDDMSISPVKQSIETRTEEATQNNDLSLKNDIDSNMVSADGGQETEVVNGPSVSIEKVTEVADLGIQASIQSPEGRAIDEFEFNQMKEQKPEHGSLNSYDSCLAVPESHNSAANGLALSIIPYPTSPIATSPPISISPRISQSRKSESKSVSKSLLSASNENTDMSFLNLSFAQTARKSMSSASKADNTSPSDRLAETLHRGLQVYDQHKQQVAARKSTVRFSMQAFNNMNTSNLLVEKVDKSVQTSQELQAFKNMEPSTLLADKVEKCLQTSQELQLAVTDSKLMNDETVLGKTSEDGEKEHDKSQWQLTPVEARKSVGEQQSSLSSAVEGVLAGSIRREIAMEEVCNRQAAEIEHLNRLVRQYKHERECNSIIQQAREEKIVRLEGLMDGVITGEEFLKDELESLSMEYKLLEEKYQNHPDVTSAKIEEIRLVEELNNYRNFYDLGERDVLLEEMKNLRTQLQYYLDRDGSRGSAKKMRQSLMTQSMQKIGSGGTFTRSLCLATIPELPSSTVDMNLMSDEKWEEENRQWTERESEWILLVDDLRAELDSVNHLAEKRQKELESEQKCSEELKEALQMAMEGHARILDQYAELQEKHIALLAKHRKIREGVSEAKRSALARGVKGAELELIEAQAAELAVLKLEREKERRNLQEEIDGLQGQLRDTVEAVQAAGELVVRLKEAEEAVTIAQDTATRSEQETEELRRDIERLKRRHVTEIATMNQRLLESRLQKASVCPMCQVAERAKYEFPPTDEASLQAEISARDVEEDTKNIEELSNEIDENEDLLRKDLHSWFRGYDKCNI